MLPLGKARIAQAGTDITLVGWGQQVRVLELAVSSHLNCLALAQLLEHGRQGVAVEEEICGWAEACKYGSWRPAGWA